MPERALHILLLAAGLSRRMGSDNKLLLPVAGKPLVRHVAECLIDADVGGLTIVTGHDADAVTTCLDGLDAAIVYNPDYDAGQMSSVRAGCRALSGDAAGIMIALADMPDLEPVDYRGLADAFFAAEAGKIVVPFHGDTRGNPVIVPVHFLAEIASGALNAGCKRLIETRIDDVLMVPVSSAAHVRDVDTPADYAGTM